MNRRAWPATVHGVAGSDMTEQLTHTHTHTHTHTLVPRNFLAFDFMGFTHSFFIQLMFVASFAF